MKRNKLLTGAVSIVCAGAMLVAGALAIQGEHNIVNQFFARAEIPPIENPFEPFVDENFDPTTGKKEVWVSNSGDTIFYARVSLWEFMQLDDAVPATKPANDTAHPYERHTPASSTLVGGTHGSATDYHSSFELVFGDDVITQEAFNTMVDNGIPVTGKWIYSSSDGYAYWSDPIQPGDSTELFLKKVNIDPTLGDYYYALDVRAEYVDKEDLWLWASTAPRGAGDQIAPVSKNVRDHFADWVTEDPEVIPTSLIRVSGLKASNLWNVGDTVAPTKVEIAPNPAHPSNPGNAGDTPVYTEVPAGSYEVIPTVIATNTEYIAIVVPTPTGKIGWYLPLGSSTPVPGQITLADGTKLIKANVTDPTANARVYEKEDGTYIYYGGNMTDMVNGGTMNPDEIFNVVYAPGVVVHGTAITTNWFFKQSGPLHAPLYPSGVNYAMCFHRGAVPGLYDGDETFGMPTPSNQILKHADQIDNFDY
jgi:hypothetical protein